MEILREQVVPLFASILKKHTSTYIDSVGEINDAFSGDSLKMLFWSNNNNVLVNSLVLFLRVHSADNHRSRYFCSCLIRQLTLGPLVSLWHSWRRRRRVSQCHIWHTRDTHVRIVYARVCNPIRRHARPSAATRCEFHYARLCGIMHEGPRCNSESLFAERRRRCIVTQSRSNDQEMRMEYALAKCPSNHGIAVCVMYNFNRQRR